MTDPLATQDKTDPLSKGVAAPAPPSQWLEFGPIAVFVALFNILRLRGNENAMLIAAGVFMVLAVIALIYTRVKHGKVPPMLIVTTLIIVITVIATLLTGDKRFFYMKPTVVNILFGIAVIVGALIHKNVLKMLMGAAYSMSDAAWNKFAWRWGFYFFACAAINEIVWRTQSEAFWANFKLFGFVPITILFILSQMPFLLKHSDLKERMNTQD